jgi:hypothetical protein
MPLSLKAFSITALGITIQKCHTLHNDTQDNDIQ